MLFTRCPDCETTFRITADALRKADGQVRCGRCARVFNAYNELRRRSRRRPAAASEQAVATSEETIAASEHAVAASEQAAPARAPATAPDARRKDDAAGGKRVGGKARVATAPGGDAVPVRSGAKSASSPSRPVAPTTASDGGSSAVAAATARARAARRQAQAAIASTSSAAARIPGNEKDPAVGDISLSGVLAELDASAAPEDADIAVKPGDGASVEAAEPDAPSPPALLAKNGLSAGIGAPPRTKADRAEKPEATDTPDAPPAWVMLDDPPRKRTAARVWTVGCIVASALLALQVLHHYRANIAVLSVVGPVIRDAYAMVGAELAPAWDLAQYEIVVDWDAVTQASADGQSNLTIAARIRNKGPRALPLPHVQVQLKDRWESTIGSRVFAPSEYLPRGARLDRLLTEGQTMLAELDILDPGPQAYGFELDVCVDAEADALRCAADEVFR